MRFFEYKDCTKYGEFVIYRDWVSGLYDAWISTGNTCYEIENFNSFEEAERAARLACDTSAIYMNTETGSVDDFSGWWFVDEKDELKNAVICGEVVEVIKVNGEWEQV